MPNLPNNHAALTPPKAEDAAASQAPRRQLRQGPRLAQHLWSAHAGHFGMWSPTDNRGKQGGCDAKAIADFQMQRRASTLQAT